MTDVGEQTQLARPGFTEVLLGAVVVLTVAASVLVLALYVLPAEHLEIPELLPSVRVAREVDFPTGSSRVVSWGERILLVVRSGDRQYAALQGTSPLDGCILEWDAESRRVVSPCSHVVFDLRGNVVTGLTTEPLLRFPVFVRNGVVYVGRES